MGLPFLIAGLVLLLAGSTWFAAATTVGWILAISGGVVILVQLLWVLLVGVMFTRDFK